MYNDTDSVEVFLRMHARDRLIEEARHIGDPSVDVSLFSAHARAERSGGLIIAALGACGIAAVALIAFRLI